MSTVVMNSTMPFVIILITNQELEISATPKGKKGGKVVVKKASTPLPMPSGGVATPKPHPLTAQAASPVVTTTVLTPTVTAPQQLHKVIS